MDRTEICYRVPFGSDVSLSLFDALGREIRGLVNASHSAGSYSIGLDGREIAPGTYFIRFEAKAGDGRRSVETAKIIHIR